MYTQPQPQYLSFASLDPQTHTDSTIHLLSRNLILVYITFPSLRCPVPGESARGILSLLPIHTFFKLLFFSSQYGLHWRRRPRYFGAGSEIGAFSIFCCFWTISCFFFFFFDFQFSFASVSAPWVVKQTIIQGLHSIWLDSLSFFVFFFLPTSFCSRGSLYGIPFTSELARQNGSIFMARNDSSVFTRCWFEAYPGGKKRQWGDFCIMLDRQFFFSCLF